VSSAVLVCVQKSIAFYAKSLDNPHPMERRNSALRLKLRPNLALLALLLASTFAHAGNGPLVLPASLSFGFQPVATTSAVQVVSVYNTGKTSFVVNTVSLTGAAYALVSGSAPVTVAAGSHADFGLTFTPPQSGTGNGSIKFTFSSSAPVSINLSGTGTDPLAIASLNTSQLTFAAQPLGSTSPGQALTITNTGSDIFNLTAVTVTYPFSQTGFTTTTSIRPGKSLTLTVSYFPTALTPQYGELQLTFNKVASKVVNLSGSGSAATALGITSFPTLPSATQSYAYQAQLTSAGGVGGVAWSLASGSSLPAGLSLSTSGTISGTVASTVAVGNYPVTVQATDSNTPPSTSTAVMTLPVYAKTGSACNNISWNIAGTTNPLVPISDLGTNTYLGAEEGGLYANGSNSRPSDDDSYGVGLAQGIQPLDSNGNPSPTGKYVMVAIGLSAPQQLFDEFVSLTSGDTSLNPSLVIVNGATGGATANLLTNSTSAFWAVIPNNYLPNAGVTAKQVVAAWVNDVDGGPSGTFPTDMTNLQSQLETISQILLTTFPNIKVAYFSSFNYTGYSNGVADLDPEPYAYESGFAVKNAIQDQLNGNANLNYNPALGPVLAPWMSWGPYYWTNGMIPRSDGLVWTCQDSKSDGTHPSNPVGRIKAATQLLNFFKTDDTATPWVLAPPKQ
jgi:hypothetical protein